MKTKPTIVLLVLSCLLLCSAVLCAQQKSKGEKVLAVKTIKGRTVGFETGDYQHVDIRLTNGKRKSFFILKPGLDYFLAVHKTSLLVLTYEVADVNLPENGLTRLERLVSAKAGSVQYEDWWKQMRAKYSVEQLDDKYGPLVSKYQLN
jgi:hypothetical protein